MRQCLCTAAIVLLAACHPAAIGSGDAGVDRCAAITCGTPPASSCIDARTLRTYATSGTCSEGTCSYHSTDKPCAGGCQHGTCEEDDPCQHVSCAAGQSCQQGTCVVTVGECGAGETCAALASNVTMPAAIAIDSARVYWTTAGQSGAIYELPLNLESPPMQLASGQPNPTAIAVSGTKVYWTTAAGLAPGSPGGVADIPLSGGSVGSPINAETSAQISTPTALALDASNVFWTEDYGLSVGCYGNVSTVALTGSSAVATSAEVAMNYFDPSIHAYEDLCNPAGIALDARNLYFTDSYRGLVAQVAKAGDQVAASVLATGQGAPLGIVLAGNQLCWVNSVSGSCSGGDCPGTIMTLTLPDGAPTTLASGQINLTGALATDGTNLYWLSSGTLANNFTDGAVLKIGLGGGTPIVVASGQPAPAGIAVDATSVYWTDQGTAARNYVDGAIMRATLK